MKPVIYLGERVAMMGGIHQVFRDAKGETYSFKGIKSVYPGETYRLDGRKGKETMKHRPQRIEPGLTLTPKEELEQETQKGIVTAHRLRRRKAMQFKRVHPNIKHAIDLLRPFYNSVNLFDRERFVKYLENEMSKRRRK